MISNVGLNDYLPFCSCENIEGLQATIHNHSSLLISVSEPSDPLNMEGKLCGLLCICCDIDITKLKIGRAFSDDFERLNHMGLDLHVCELYSSELGLDGNRVTFCFYF